MRFFFSAILLVSCVAAQPRNRLTFSGGWSQDIGQTYSAQTATGLGLSYGYRFHKFMETEAGFFTATDPTGDVCSAHGCVDVKDHYFWVPFGIRFVVPMYGDRLELSAGGGGLWEKYFAEDPFPGGGNSSRDGWGGYFVGSMALRLDHGGHFWLSATPRWFLANPAYARDRWFQMSAEVSFRF